VENFKPSRITTDRERNRAAMTEVLAHLKDRSTIFGLDRDLTDGPVRRLAIFDTPRSTPPPWERDCLTLGVVVVFSEKSPIFSNFLE
jgi:hypothetical protein